MCAQNNEREERWRQTTFSWGKNMATLPLPSRPRGHDRRHTHLFGLRSLSASQPMPLSLKRNDFNEASNWPSARWSSIPRRHSSFTSAPDRSSATWHASYLECPNTGEGPRHLRPGHEKGQRSRDGSSQCCHGRPGRVYVMCLPSHLQNEGLGGCNLARWAAELGLPLCSTALAGPTMGGADLREQGGVEDRVGG